MKKNCIIILSLGLLLSCNNQHQSAFTGEVETTTLPVGTIPDESIYNLTDTFTSQDHKIVKLRDLAGKPTVLCMIFTHCAYACPRLTADLMDIEKKLGKKASQVNFVLVSFDSERDTPEQLEKYKKEMQLDDNFLLLHGSEDAVRTLSVLMNIQYQKNQDGDFSHSNVISVLDKQGKLISQKEGINVSQDETLKALNEAM